MANIPIKHINSGDTVNTAFDIVNYNFDLLLLNGGGPRGIQGTHGLQGNRGIQGPQGLQGSKGVSVYTSIEEAQANNGIYFDTRNLYTIDYSGGGGGSEEQHVSEETASLNPFILQDDVIRTNTASAEDRPLVLGLGEKRLTDGAVGNVNSSLNVVCGVPSDSSLQYGSMSFLHCRYREEDPNALEISGKSVVRGDGNGGLHIEPAREIRIHGNDDNRSGVVLDGLYGVQNGSLLNVGNTGIVGSAEWAAVGNTFFPTSGPGVIGGDSASNMIGRIKMHNTTYNSLTGNNGIIESPNGIALSVGNGGALHSFNRGTDCVCLYDGNKHSYSLKSLDAPALFIRNRERNIPSTPCKDRSVTNIINPHCATITVSSTGNTQYRTIGLLQMRGQGVVMDVGTASLAQNPIANEQTTYEGMNSDVFVGGGDYLVRNMHSSSAPNPGNGGTAYMSGGVSAKVTRNGEYEARYIITDTFGDVKIGINPLLHYGEALTSEEETQLRNKLSSTYETRDVDICANRIVSVNADLRDVDNGLGVLDPKKSVAAQVNANLTVANQNIIHKTYQIEGIANKYRNIPVLIDDLSDCSVMSGVMLNGYDNGLMPYICRWVRVGDIVTATYIRNDIPESPTTYYAFLPLIYVSRVSGEIGSYVYAATSIPDWEIPDYHTPTPNVYYGYVKELSSCFPDTIKTTTIAYDLSCVREYTRSLSYADVYTLPRVVGNAGSTIYSPNIRSIFSIEFSSSSEVSRF